MAERRPHGRRPEGRGRRLLKAVGFGLAFAVPVTALAFVVREKFLPVIELDGRLIVAATDITRDNPWLKTVLLVWQEATQPKWVYIIASGVCLVVWRRHRELATRCLWAFLTMMVAWNLQLVLKEVVRRARPVVSDPVSHAPGYSFPSGHVANAAAIATVMTLLLWPVLSPVARRWLVAGLTAYVVLTALDRVFLGVHYPSDVLAGVLFGIGLGTASYVGYLGWNPQGLDETPPPEGDVGPESSKGST
ncbi:MULTISPECIES: phosphatase PAP2 family protein [unclassified Terrabacter]|uniref:phosphatase PAP2 family protein n=1 Tax=unclassified Terrabacter TaxID=2630222 RepID=UPI0006F50267|nr:MULTISPECIES: phosphatase PAP2 family protein [unclassified Terrabacter]KRB47263.1 phosphoesterase PA-phosphatase [Terrabacter sp. Root181]KRF38756.1 phosphoesterase PA-phosphatase [Terrabacter sp. Soil810]